MTLFIDKLTPEDPRRWRVIEPYSTSNGFKRSEAIKTTIVYSFWVKLIPLSPILGDVCVIHLAHMELGGSDGSIGRESYCSPPFASVGEFGFKADRTCLRSLQAWQLLRHMLLKSVPISIKIIYNRIDQWIHVIIL